MQEAELKRVFQLISKDKGETVDKADFELLLMSLGFNISAAAIEGCINEISSMYPSSQANKIQFQAFASWWMDKDSMFLYTKRS